MLLSVVSSITSLSTTAIQLPHHITSHATHSSSCSLYIRVSCTSALFLPFASEPRNSRTCVYRTLAHLAQFFLDIAHRHRSAILHLVQRTHTHTHMLVHVNTNSLSEATTSQTPHQSSHLQSHLSPNNHTNNTKNALHPLHPPLRRPYPTLPRHRRPIRSRPPRCHRRQIHRAAPRPLPQPARVGRGTEESTR
jgi:hypothetical protein